MNDPIVEEIRRIREAHAAKFSYDLDAIFRDIKEHEIRSGLIFVSFSAPTPSGCRDGIPGGKPAGPA